MKPAHSLFAPALFLALAACASTPEPSFLPASFRALGTEPFWNARVAGGQLTYTTPEDTMDGGDPAGLTIAVERIDRAGAVELRGALKGQQLRITITPGQCSDGMSDNTYPWKAERTLGTDVQRGCAEPVAE